METVKVRCSKCSSQGFWPANNTTYRCWNCESLTQFNTKAPPSPPRQGQWLNLKPVIFRNVSNSMVCTSNQNPLSKTKPSPTGTCVGSLNTKPSPAKMLSGKRPSKRALLCGVTYNRKGKYMLKGTVNDVKDMRELLIEQYNYPPHCIRVLTEFEPEKEFHPTKKNIENSLKWLVEGCQFGDSLVFYFSGHGLRQPDFKNDEVDGFDETICPVDFMEQGMIFDNDINITIVRPLVEGVILHAIVDACHSGTILDLQFVFDHKNKRWEDHTPCSGARKTTSGGLAICISACEDHQLAADTTAFSGKTLMGALTYIFLGIIKQYADITYGQLLDLLSETFDVNGASKCLTSRTLARLFGQRINQV